MVQGQQIQYDESFYLFNQFALSSMYAALRTSLAGYKVNEHTWSQHDISVQASVIAFLAAIHELFRRQHG